MIRLNNETRQQYIQAIVDSLHDSQIEQFRDVFLEIHPQDQVDIFNQFDETLRKRCYEFLSPREFALIFEGLSLKNQLVSFGELDARYFSEVFNNMFTDDVGYFLKGIDVRKQDEILSQMDEEQAKKIRTLLAYEPETAGSIMTKEFVSIKATDQAEYVIEQLREDAPSAEIIYYNDVVNEVGELVGVVSLRDLITAKLDDVIEDVMLKNVISVDEQMDQEEVALTIQKYDLLAVPVVSKDERLLGIVTVDDVMDILEEETTEDFGELSAVKGATDLDIGSFEAAKKRSPWIVALMFFGLLTAGVIGQFEETLEQVVLLAAFVPMI